VAVLTCERSIGYWAEPMLTERVKLSRSNDSDWTRAKTKLILALSHLPTGNEERSPYSLHQQAP
jgi:hypothetical protein